MTSFTPEILEKGHIVIDLAGRQVYCCGNLIELTTLNFNLFLYLFQHANQVCNFDELLENVWKYSKCQEDTHVVRLAISRLRKSFQTCYCCQGNYLQIRTIREIGYCLQIHGLSIKILQREN